MRFQTEKQNVDADQWHKNGDHPHDDSNLLVPGNGEPFLSEGKVVRYYRHPDLDGHKKCTLCGVLMKEHGWIDNTKINLVGELEIVCPGDYVETIPSKDPQTNQSIPPYKYKVWRKKDFERAHICIQEPTIQELDLMLSDGRARFLWDVIINNKPYPVYDIDSRHHWNGQANGAVDTWWIRWGGEVHPYVESRGFLNRIVHEITFKQVNTAKVKWDEMRTSSSIQCEIKANGKIIYSFGCGGGYFDFAMGKAQYMIVALGEHPYNFYKPEENNGRRIWWYNLPATVKVRSDGWEIAIIPDYTAGLTKEQWWREYKNRKTKLTATKDEHNEDMHYDNIDEEEHDDEINWGDAFSDQHINWFRSDPTPKNPPQSQSLTNG